MNTPSKIKLFSCIASAKNRTTKKKSIFMKPTFFQKAFKLYNDRHNEETPAAFVFSKHPGF